MKKKLILIAFSLILCLAMIPIIAAAKEDAQQTPISYLDSNGDKQSMVGYNILGSNDTEWKTGWYVVNKDVTISDRVEVKGYVQLILADGGNLNVNGGIHVSDPYSLTIYGQSMKSTGYLTVGAPDWKTAGIGGNFSEACGDITINGGNIVALDDVGIGNGYWGMPDKIKGDNIAINGGNIDASQINCGSGPVTFNPPEGYVMIAETMSGETIGESPFKGSQTMTEIIRDYTNIRIRTSEAKLYDINFISENGSAKASPDKAYAGQTVKLTPIADKYYDFKEWQPENAKVDSNNCFIMPEGDVSIKAVFGLKPKVLYLNEYGKAQTCKKYIPLSSSLPKLSDGEWYVADKDIKISDRVEVEGNVSLILTDGFTLDFINGIHVGKESTLTIYGQSKNKGCLNCGNNLETVTKYGAGIGGNERESSGRIIINGGKINSIGASASAGIGGGRFGGNGYVTINGGIIYAESSDGAAIGGGSGERSKAENSRGYVTITGGDITATTKHEGAVIGGGYGGDGEINISGGKIKVIGTDDAVGIGGVNSHITITGGEITAEVQKGKGISTGSEGWIIISPETCELLEVKTGEKEIDGSPFESEQKIENEFSDCNKVYIKPKEMQGSESALKSKVLYLDENGQTRACKKFISIEDSMTAWSDEGSDEVWYVVDKNVDISDRVEVSGNVHLILVNGFTLNCKNGIHVIGENTLTIYGQSNNKGVLCCGYDYGAGIGANDWKNENSGQITINGGDITSTSLKGTGAAGIGGGARGGKGYITINGGIIHAESRLGAAIGGGYNYYRGIDRYETRGIVTITGGEIYATANQHGAAIGGGDRGGGEINISGGKIVARGTYEAVGIGGPDSYITITGGDIDAEFERGEGICAGSEGWIKISPETCEMLEVKTENGIIEGSPFENEQNIENKLSGCHKVCVKPVNGKDTMQNLFVDVKADNYFYNAVQWASGENITSGIDATHFGPNVSCTRAQMVTFLWRAMGCPEPTASASQFTDVEKGSYYEKAVAWAVEKGITKGISDTLFAPKQTVTRGQSVTFLARTAGIADDAAGYSHSFKDVSTKDYFNNAVAWAASKNITTGVSETEFAPKADCTRAQIVTFLYRYIAAA